MRALGLGLLLISVGIIGCGPDIRTECEEEVQCRGGNDLDIDACVAVNDVLGDFIADIGCGAEYDAYFACIEPFTTCRSVPTGDPCMDATECSSDEACTNGECVEKRFGATNEDEEKCKVERAEYASCFGF